MPEDLKIIVFGDPQDGHFFVRGDAYRIQTTNSEEEIREAVDEIIEEMEKEGNHEWSYKDVLERLEIKGLLNVHRETNLQIYTVMV